MAEGETPAGEVGLGVPGMILQEGLVLLDCNRIKLPVVGAIGNVVLLEARIVLGGLGRSRLVLSGGGMRWYEEEGKRGGDEEAVRVAERRLAARRRSVR